MNKTEAAIAFAQGKRVQTAVAGGWANITQYAQFDGPWEDFRLKPAPVPPGDLTWDEARELHEEGVSIQFCAPGHYSALADECGAWDDVVSWFDCSGRNEIEAAAYRRKPQPKRVPLGPEDVPPGSVFRNQHWGRSWSACLGAWTEIVGLATVNADAPALAIKRSYQALLDEGWQISRDGGKTWEPCWKEETNG